MAKLGRLLFLFWRFLVQNLKIKLEYKADSLLLFVSGAALQALGFLFLQVLFSRIPAIDGWSLWELVFLLSAIFISEGVVSFAFEGSWNLSFILNQGELDRMLLRPVSPILQITSFTLGIHGIGNMALGFTLMVLSLQHIAVHWDLAKVLFLPVMVLSAGALRAAISFASNCAAFWIQGFSNAFPLMVYQVADFAKFPTNLFGTAIQVFVTALVPYAFISYVPAVYLFDKADWGWMAWLTPLVALWAMVVAHWIFYRGLRRYEGAGS